MRDLAEVQARLEAAGYVTEHGLALAIALAEELRRPLLVEGEAGVGKTAIAKAIADAFDHVLIRLQCYEGLDINNAVYEWNYQRQLMTIKLYENQPHSTGELQDEIFSERYLLQRPLLRAIRMDEAPVLLIDEIDRADEEFEAYLLELLADYQISVPELGTITAVSTPYVVLTSNASRELSDALRRRCLYYYLPFPGYEKELRIVTTRLPALTSRLACQVVSFVQSLRTHDLRKKPGIAETLDWSAALIGLGVSSLDEDPQKLSHTMMCLLKTRQDQAAANAETIMRLITESVEASDEADRIPR
ncbi:MAG: MoxR family ATPase [Deltaproteobacteria bacterium]|nr:MoxR family ATPase [Deltaproteobacteria bacterium]